MMKANVLGMDGSVKGSLELPSVFETEYKPKLIKRAALALQTTKKQPKGNDQRAGKKNTADYFGYRGVPAYRRTINVEHARLPRMQNRGAVLYGRVAYVPQSVGGHRAHGLKAWETIVEKINKKERRLALKSAIAATNDKKLVALRFIFDKELPIIVEDKFESVAKTAEVVEVLNKVGVGKDLENAKDKIRRRAGRGKSRGRVWKGKKSVLIVVGKNSPLLKASRNLPGVEAVTTQSLNVDLLAPGAEAGRLVVWTKSAVEELGKSRTVVNETDDDEEEVEVKAEKVKAAPKVQAKKVAPKVAAKVVKK
jgi:large subunit ribosomal protein L4e